MHCAEAMSQRAKFQKQLKLTNYILMVIFLCLTCFPKLSVM